MIKNRVLNTIWLFLVAFNLWSAEPGEPLNIDVWFAANPRAVVYLSVKNELFGIQKLAEAHALPFELLFNKFLEGVAKNAKPDQILIVLSEELRRLETITRLMNMIDNINREKNKRDYFQWTQDDSLDHKMADTLSGILPHTLVFKTRTEIIMQIAIFIRSGITPAVMERIFLFTQERSIPFLLPFYLFSEIIKIPAFSRLTDDDVYRLNHAVLSSSLSLSSYAVIPSLFLKGSRYDLDYQALVQIIAEKLEQGGSFIRIEQEFKRRGRQ